MADVKDDLNLTQEQRDACWHAETEAEAELVAAALHRAVQGLLNTQQMSVSGVESGIATHHLRSMTTVLEWLATKGRVEDFARIQTRFLEMLANMAQQIGGLEVVRPGDGRVH